MTQLIMTVLLMTWSYLYMWIFQLLTGGGVINSNYRQTSNISRTKSQRLNLSRPVLQLSLPSQFKQGVKSRMKM